MIIRSKYTLEQFNEKLQLRAHADACRIITSLSETARIDIKPGQVERIEGVETEYRFYDNHSSYTLKGRKVEKPSKYWKVCPSCGNSWIHEDLCERCGAKTTPQIDYTYPDQLDIDIEHKIYINSPHSTKISYYAPEDAKEAKAKKERVEQFIADLMKGVKPKPRFSLAAFSKQ